MTREEALKILKNNLNVTHQTIDEITDPKRVKILDMAIKIIEKELCKDVINREILKKQMIKYGFHAPDMTVTEFVDDLPPVNPKPKTQELHRAIFDKGYEQGQRDMVDKIRTEIVRHSYEGFDLGSFRDDYNSALVEVLNIIDKYKIEVRIRNERSRIKFC